MSESRVVEIAGLRNLRDVGGLPAANGRVTRRGLIYRAEAPVALPAQGIEALAELRLKTALDLRGRHEDEFIHTTLPDGVERVYVGIQPPADPDGRGLVQQVIDGDLLDYDSDQLAAMYIGWLEDQAEPFGRAIAFCAQPANLPTLVHCHAGKDRTGLVVAMLLDNIGVQRDAIISDYALSSRYRAYRREEVASALAASGTHWDRVAPLFIAPPETLATALSHLEQQHGSTRAFLTGPGRVPADLLDGLPELLTESQDSPV
jgi:protein-tyrosine phosphatase